MKIAHIMSEIETENRAKDQVKEKFGPRGSNSQGNRNFKRFKHGMKQDKGKQAGQLKPRKTYDQCGRQHPGPCRSFTSPCFGCGGMGHKVANCPKVTWNSRSHTQRFGTGFKLAAQRDRLTVLYIGLSMRMLCFYMMVLWIIGLFTTLLNQVGSWMARGGIIEEFEVLMVSVVWGGTLGCDYRNRVDCEAMRALLSKFCRIMLWSVWMC